MDIDTYYTDHWKHIEEERIARYERMFEWRDGQAALLAPAAIEAGHRVLDFGSGPGFMALAIADIVGESGRVHGVDINARFVADATRRAEGRAHVSFHHVTGAGLPLPDAAVDRVVCKNVLEYVPDLDTTLAELRRVLAPEGRIHIMDSDWGFVVVEPWGKENVDRYFAAASVAFREPHIGRKAQGLLAKHGFDDIEVRIQAFADTQGRSLPVIRNMRTYIDAALEAGGETGLSSDEADALLAQAERAVAEGTFLFSLPQFLVTGTKP
ncbi:MAG: methyltransferase domain-containing protein [Gammaproteobacteria bacterium]|nr:methyltransferase domain-containing protein [Gammaproteobacteria bacterium]